MAGETSTPGDIAAASAAPAEAGSNTDATLTSTASPPTTTSTGTPNRIVVNNSGGDGETEQAHASGGSAEPAKNAAGQREARFIFRELAGKPFAPLEDKETQALLGKW